MSYLKKKLVRTADSPSLWNNTLSPGWTLDELNTLRMAIMKFGLGAWAKIAKSQCLPGKTPAQINLQTQRMLGQQSLGEFMGIHLDPYKVWAENSQKTGVKRKNGCIVNTGNNPTKEERRRKIEENTAKWGISQEEIDAIEIEAKEMKDPLTIKEENKEKLKQLRANFDYMVTRLEKLKKGEVKPKPAVLSAEVEELKPTKSVPPPWTKAAPKSKKPKVEKTSSANSASDDDKNNYIFEDSGGEFELPLVEEDDDSDFESEKKQKKKPNKRESKKRSNRS